jgi:Xaa-Pro aminopeptidase
LRRPDRINDLRHRLEEQSFDAAVITDDDSVYYLTGYYDYLHMETGPRTRRLTPQI